MDSQHLVRRAEVRAYLSRLSCVCAQAACVRACAPACMRVTRACGCFAWRLPGMQGRSGVSVECVELQAHKAAAHKVAEGLKEQVAEAEERLVRARAEAADKMHEFASKHAEEKQVLSRKLADATRACERLQLQRAQVEAQAQEAATKCDALMRQVRQLADEKERALDEARQAESRARQAQACTLAP